MLKVTGHTFSNTLLSMKPIIHQYFMLSKLMIFLIGICLPMLLFSILAGHIWNQGSGLVWDIPVLQVIHTTAQPVLDAIALTVTPLGVIWGVFPVLFVIGCVLLSQRSWRSLLYLIITPLGSALLNYLIKLYFHRARPQLWDILTPDTSYAFPSGHAMSSMTLIVVLAVLAWQTQWRWLVLIGGIFFAFIIGWTRLYLGMHYPSDILAGWMVAIAWSLSMMLIFQPFKSTEKVQAKPFLNTTSF